ncbi:PorP/SprF family type IX secretion system membrane protein [Flavihumibacter cheonanensis]|jgi:type IX secretion system PorP/SprF family membrane protein|uniref:PorP/SprF family type IX secretion system membrane protein n=1 Tax=Flavihumibacter cheonanensis TaxID=1442385 RepID=UPI001EF85FBB|nr:PorP/SprF family type IX secretion system membrane protein [Flavihumibacter cheonanensis]MCG7754390.1 PorP/SprF family type IX secretion system membrane protein [Flavihumibacter cheonanensis]
MMKRGMYLWRFGFCILLALFTMNLSFAQDLRFSQWFNSPLTTNPANTGFIPDADFRIGANYRSQFINVMDVPYKTISIFGDAQIMRDRIENGWLGVGGVILRDVAGSGNLTSTKVYGSLAYHQMLGLSSLLSAGFNLGWANKRIDPTRLKFPDQFNQATGFFDAGVPTNVAFNSTSIGYMDMQVGLNYAYFPTEDLYVNGGFSVHHINRPRETFFTETGFDNRLAPRYIGFVNASVKVNQQVIVNPMAYYTNQASASELVGGLSANYNLSGDGETQVIGGMYYRVGESLIPLIGFQWKNFRMSFTYDVTTSSLAQYNGARGAIEFSLLKHGFYSEGQGNLRQSLCPTF